jgi:hypothetical protein
MGVERVGNPAPGELLLAVEAIGTKLYLDAVAGSFGYLCQRHPAVARLTGTRAVGREEWRPSVDRYSSGVRASQSAVFQFGGK